MEHRIEVEKGVTIFVEDINPTGKETILFLHGWPLSLRAFEYQYDKIPFQGFRCVAMDMRGFGDSSKPMDGYDYDTLARDLHQVIVSLNLNRVSLLGHSFGGAVAVRYMAKYKQQYIKNLILAGAMVPSLIRRPDFPYGVSEDSITELIQDTYNNRPQMLSRFGDLCFFQFVTDSLATWFLQLGLKAAGYATIQTAMSYRGTTLIEDMKEITVPTLIMHGVHDRVVPYALASIIKNGIVNSKLVPFEQSGHMLFYEEKTLFNRTLMDFVNKPTP